MRKGGRVNAWINWKTQTPRQRSSPARRRAGRGRASAERAPPHHAEELLELGRGGLGALGVDSDVLRVLEAQAGEVLDALRLRGAEEERLARLREEVQDRVQRRGEALRADEVELRGGESRTSAQVWLRRERPMRA